MGIGRISEAAGTRFAGRARCFSRDGVENHRHHGQRDHGAAKGSAHRRRHTLFTAGATVALARHRHAAWHGHAACSIRGGLDEYVRTADAMRDQPRGQNECREKGRYATNFVGQHAGRIAIGGCHC